MGVVTSLKKATREIEKVITGTEPEVDILDTLAEEHEVVSALLQQLVEAKSSAQRVSLLGRIKNNLVPHARAEEAVLYKALLRIKDKEAQTNGAEGFIEHALVDVTLKKLSNIKDKMSPQFGAGAKVLKELIAHHVKEEENNVWSDAKEYFTSEERRQLNRIYLAKKKTIKVPA